MINGIKNSNRRQNANTGFSGIGNFKNVEIIAKEIETNKTKLLAGEVSGAKNFLSNYILTSQTDFDFARLLPHLESVSLVRGEEIPSFNERTRYVYFPETAVISNLYTLADGSTIEVAMIGREGASELGSVLGSQIPSHWSQVAVGGTALRIKSETLRKEFVHGGKMQTLLFDYINSHITQISQRVACKSFHVIEKRFCNWLLMLHDRVKQNHLPMTQEQISLFLGVHRPSVTLVAQTLRDKGLIDYVRGKVHILDRQGLESSACECYSAIQQSLLNPSYC